MKLAVPQIIMTVSFLFAPRIFAQDRVHNERKAGISLSFDASRAWYGSSSDSWKTDSTFLNGSYLFLGQHFHFGPAFNIGRYYSESYSSTSYGIAALGKWTVEDLRVAKQTPFAILRTGLSGSVGDHDSKSETKHVDAVVGYEYFINDFVSLSNGIKATKAWAKDRGRSVFDNSKYTRTSTNAKAGLELALSVYL
jgi:hypothetical protein